MYGGGSVVLGMCDDEVCMRIGMCGVMWGRSDMFGVPMGGYVWANRDPESTHFHPSREALLGLCLQALALPRSLTKFYGRKSPPMYGGLGGCKNRDLTNQLLN